MTRIKLKDILKTVAGVIIGVSSHHYGGQLLDRKNIEAEDAAQAIRDKNLEEMIETLNSMNSLLQDCVTKVEKTNENSTIS